ncbi:MAG: CoA pyrophosphatase [Firmicutes bacterium]|nr:CoA pyrophosphatase [Bacillota bacterium]
MNIDKTYIENIKCVLERHLPSAEGSGKPSAVLMPLIEHNGSIHIVLTQRAFSMKHQPGDFCFPGGHGENDETPDETAIRETCEELGIKKENIKLIGETDFIISMSNMYIRSFVGFLHDINIDDFVINNDEVEKVIAVPLDFFINTTPSLHVVNMEPRFSADFPFHLIYGGKNYNWRTASMKEWFYNYKGDIIWGLTARIINNFKSIIGV